MGLRDAWNALIGKGSQYEGLIDVSERAQTLISRMTPADLYRTQPHLRTVVSFRARNVAQLGLPLYRRVSDTDRARVTDDPAVKLLSRPNPDMTRYELIEALVADIDLYDEAYWWILPSDSESGWQIRPLSPAWLDKKIGTAFATTTYRMTIGARQIDIPADDMLVFHGWNPARPRDGAAPVDALKNVLLEQIQAWEFRQQMWSRGGRIGAYLTRPKDAPGWSDEARQRFKRDWGQFQGSGAKAGSTPVLEDGMEMKRVGFTAKEEQWLEGAKLALSTVASIYHVNPVMVGILDNANFSNTREFRKMLYSDTLGPLLTMIQDRINAFLIPKVSSASDVYFEFNIQQKLAGDFIETATILSTSVGGPWMTRNEARARQNLPAIEGADDLIVPLNVLEGGQASPQDSGEQNRNASTAGAVKRRKTRSFKSADIDLEEHQQRIAAVLRDFYERQEKAVLARINGAKAADWWDEDEWNDELTGDLFTVAADVAATIGKDQAKALGFDPDDYDTERTEKFLKAVAASRAGAINSTTYDEIEAALKENTDPQQVFDTAKSARVDSGSAAMSVFLAGFAVIEATKQLAPQQATKTWVTGPNPRPEHAAMDGDTVPLGQPFSNGANWPGDPTLGAEGVANCFIAETEVAAGQIETGFRRLYSGALVTVETDGGKKLTGTPNHPILTADGWVKLGDLVKGQHVVCYGLGVESAADVGIDGQPSKIGEVVDSLAKSGTTVRPAMLVVDFHGDGEDGNVDVVLPDRELRDGLEVASAYRVGNDLLALSEEAVALLKASGADDARLSTLAGTAQGEVRGESLRGSVARGHAGVLVDGGGTAVADGDAMVVERASDHDAREAEFDGQAVFGFAGEVSLDKIASVSVRQVDSPVHVYNLQTRHGMYAANAIVAHNCNCSVIVNVP